MAGGEDEAQEIVADVVVDCCVEIRHGLFLSLKLATEFLVLALEPRVSAEVIDGTMLGSGHKPGAWIVWDARLRPLLESSDESILCEILGSTDVAHDPRETGNEPRRLDSPDCVDGAMCIGGRHATDHTIFNPSAQVEALSGRERSESPL